MSAEESAEQGMKINNQQIVAIFLSSVSTLGLDGASVIGAATSSGDFRLNERMVASSGTLVEGSALETKAAASTLRLQGGTRLDLAPASRSRIFKDRSVLDQGGMQFQPAGGYRIEARDIFITSESSAARGSVELRSGEQVAVSAAQGELRVANREGVLLARVIPGRALMFSQAAGGAPTTSLMGVVEKVGDGFFLTDKVSGVRVQLQGQDLAKFVGQSVRVTGTLQSGTAGASTLTVSSVGPGVGAGGISAGAAAAASSSKLAAIIAGVSVASIGGVGAAVAASTSSGSPARGLGPSTISTP